ncbi:MAG: hypothetical protein ACKVOM_00670 [Ferruginibacter sp.]
MGTNQPAEKKEISLRERDLIRAAYNITRLTNLAHFTPDLLVQCMDIETYPGETGYAFTDQQIKDWLFSYSIDLTLPTINEILEIGFREGFYAKRERKNSKGELICLTWLIN